MSRLNIVFAGTPEFGIPCLSAIADAGHNVCAVYTQPDRPAGRGRKVQFSAVKTWAIAHSCAVYQPENFKDPASIAQLSNLHADIMVVIAYGLILPKKVLAIPRLGCINVHASLLPRWRGAAPIQQAILAGDKETGVTIMQMDAGMDTGDILSLAKCPILPTDTAGSLHDKLAKLAIDPLLQVLHALSCKKVEGDRQNNDLASYAGKITKEQARIDWRHPAEAIARQIRAYNPWPISFTLDSAENTVRIYEAEAVPLDTAATPGCILAIDKTGILIAAGENALRLKKIQFGGGKVITIQDWINSGHHRTWLHKVLL